MSASTVPLSAADLEVLEFERLRFSSPGARESAIFERFAVLAPRHSQRLLALLDHPDALAYDPALVNRTRRVLTDRRTIRRTA